MRALTSFALSGSLVLVLAAGGQASATAGLGPVEEPMGSALTPNPTQLPTFSSSGYGNNLGDIEGSPPGTDIEFQSPFRTHGPIFLDRQHTPVGAIDEGYEFKRNIWAGPSVLMVVLMGLGGLSFLLGRVVRK